MTEYRQRETERAVLADEIRREWAEYHESEEWDGDSILTDERLSDVMSIATSLMTDGYSRDESIATAIEVVAMA